MAFSIHRPRLAAAGLLVLAACGCAMNTPSYQPSIDNVERLRAAGIEPVKVGAVAAQPGAAGATTIGLRGNTMSSSVGSGYADYLAEALRRELELARLLNPASRIEVSAALIRNDIAAGGIATNSGEIEARFVVTREGRVAFDRVKRIEMTWESSFAGNVAIPRAQQQYPLMVQKLLTELFSDTEFIAACR